MDMISDLDQILGVRTMLPYCNANSQCSTYFQILNCQAQCLSYFYNFSVAKVESVTINQFFTLDKFFWGHPVCRCCNFSIVTDSTFATEKV